MPVIRKKLYPSTKRVGIDKETIVITEKLDGSNLGFGKLEGELYIATRNNIFFYKDLEEQKVRNLLYKGLYQWLVDNGEELEETLNEGSLIFGEWLGMGKLKYPDMERYYMFAKANAEENFDGVRNLKYDVDLFTYSFDQEKGIPHFINIVPVVKEIVGGQMPTIEYLDELYDEYTGTVGRDVEGFIVNNQSVIRKYVRMKQGVLEPHYLNPKYKQ